MATAVQDLAKFDPAQFDHPVGTAMTEPERLDDDRFRLPRTDSWSATSSEAVERMRAVAEATRGFPSLLMLDADRASLRIPVERTGYASEVAAEFWATWEALGLIDMLRPRPSRCRRLWLWLTGWLP